MRFRILTLFPDFFASPLSVSLLGKAVSRGVLQIEVTNIREFAPGDRVMFLRNERGLGLKNGTLARVEEISPTAMTARLDSGGRVTVAFKDYNHLDHGYAATIHKAQGVTVDRTHVLASPGLDRHATYVALSRHRSSVDLHYGREDFADQRPFWG